MLSFDGIKHILKVHNSVYTPHKRHAREVCESLTLVVASTESRRSDRSTNRPPVNDTTTSMGCGACPVESPMSSARSGPTLRVRTRRQGQTAHWTVGSTMATD